jgi:hypothetical protein
MRRALSRFDLQLLAVNRLRPAAVDPLADRDQVLRVHRSAERGVLDVRGFERTAAADVLLRPAAATVTFLRLALFLTFDAIGFRLGLLARKDQRPARGLLKVRRRQRFPVPCHRRH